MKNLQPLEIQVRKTIGKFDMLKEGDHVVVAVSGGADSMALLHSLFRLAPVLRLALTVAHLNHGIRGAEGDSDQEFVKQVCELLGLPFITETAHLLELSGPGKRNLEELARRARYDFLRRTAARLKARKIAVGHTLNDQAETVLLRVFRGSGPDGLSAIHPVVDNLIIRPLLEIPRRQVAQYLAKLGVSHREDSTNRNLNFRRNRARYELIPYLEDSFNPRLLEALARQAELSRDIADYLEANSRREYESLRRQVPDGIAMQVQRLMELHPALRKLVVRQALRDFRGSLAGITTRNIQDVLRLCRQHQSGRRILLPNKAVAYRQFGDLLLMKGQGETGPPFCYRLPVPGQCTVAEAGLRIVASFLEPPCNHNKKIDFAHQAHLDAETLPDMLTVRSRLPGDRYGGPRHRKVKKLLIDAKIARQARAALPMVVADQSVIWIPGFKPAKYFAVHPNSSRCIVLEVREIADCGLRIAD